MRGENQVVVVENHQINVESDGITRIYSGELLNGEPHGRGAMQYIRDGRVLEFYNGEWVEGMQHGQGTLQDDLGMYTGQFDNGVKCGNGVMQYMGDGKIQQIYRGQWYNDEENGRGVMQYMDEDGKVTYICEGMWKDGLPDGEVLLRDNEGVYKGTLLDNGKKDKGVMQYMDECRDIVRTYEGAWQDNMPHGKGRMEYGNGEIYDGMWQMGIYHGKGFLCGRDATYESACVDKDGRECEEVLDDKGVVVHYKVITRGKRGVAEIVDIDQMMITEGGWRDGKLHGGIKHSYGQGVIFIGNYENGVRCGLGVEIHPNESRYIGEWKNDQKNGEGEYLSVTGEVFKGRWENGNMVERYQNGPDNGRGIM